MNVIAKRLKKIAELSIYEMYEDVKKHPNEYKRFLRDVGMNCDKEDYDAIINKRTKIPEGEDNILKCSDETIQEGIEEAKQKGLFDENDDLFRFFASNSGQTFFAQSKKLESPWIEYLEKAYQKIHNSYISPKKMWKALDKDLQKAFMKEYKLTPLTDFDLDDMLKSGYYDKDNFNPNDPWYCEDEGVPCSTGYDEFEDEIKEYYQKQLERKK